MGDIETSSSVTEQTKEDEFTDLPLDDDDEVGSKKETPLTKEPVEAVATSHDQSSQESSPTESRKVTSNTTAYDPDLYPSGPTSNGLQSNDGSLHLEIIDAGKSREGQSRGYIVYTIKCNGILVRRRYSEFESLRTALIRLFPTMIIPPIPEKHALTKYAAAPTKAKEDSNIIDHRRRMLAVFLNRCVQIEKIRESDVLQSFLDSNSNWPEVLNSAALNQIPKNLLQSDPLDPAHSSAAHSYLPIPSSSVYLGKETEDDKNFHQVEKNAREYEAVISNGIEKSNKKIIRHFSEFSTELSEVGADLNAFSLQENGDLASTLERIGQVHDNCFLSTQALVKALNYDFSEPLGESVQFATVVKEVLKFRQSKSLQTDITSRMLKHKSNQLKLLEKAELESKRIDDALKSESAKTGQINFDRNQQSKAPEEESTPISNEPSQDITPLEPKKTSMFKIPGISKISNAIKEAIETDPEVTRQHNLSKCKEDLNQLTQTNKVATEDLTKVTESIRQELEIFQTSKEEDLKKMILAYTTHILDWSKKNRELWEEAKTEINSNV